MSNLIRRAVRNMAGYVPGEQPGRDEQVIKLNTNENPYPPSPRVAEVLALTGLESLRRYPDPLSMRLRRRIAELHGCDPSCVFVGNGSDEALALCTRAFVEADGSIGYFQPSYSLYPVLAEIHGVEQRPVELGPEFEWRMPGRYQCSLFFLTNPNAPTGIQYPKAEVDRFCARFPGVVLIDEAYADFAQENCMELVERYANVLVARTLSKAFSLAGLRLGYAVGPRELVEALFKVKDSYNVDALSQEIALAALGDVDYMRANVMRIRATRERLRDALQSLGHRVYPSETNFLWVKPKGLVAADFYRELKEKGVLIRYFPGERTVAFVRITVGTDAEVDRLLDAVKTMGHRG